jgi:hypothetical protein
VKIKVESKISRMNGGNLEGQPRRGMTAGIAAVMTALRTKKVK